jgi:hypothetical protein
MIRADPLPATASCCTVLSSFGVLILLALGWAFDLVRSSSFLRPTPFRRVLLLLVLLTVPAFAGGRGAHGVHQVAERSACRREELLPCVRPFPPLAFPSCSLEDADLLFPTQCRRLRSVHSLLRLSSTSPCSLFRSAVRLISSFLSSPDHRSA